MTTPIFNKNFSDADKDLSIKDIEAVHSIRGRIIHLGSILENLIRIVVTKDLYEKHKKSLQIKSSYNHLSFLDNLIIVVEENKHLADIAEFKTKAEKLWNRIDLIGKMENVQIIHEENGQQVIHLDRVSCVFEMYNGCSMFIVTPNQRKMIVALEGTAEFMNQLANAGVYVDEESARMGVKSLDCTQDGILTVCKIEEDEKEIN